jgi:hypothetical protein
LDPGFQRAVAVARRIIEDGLHDEEVAKARVALDVGAVSAVLRKDPARVIGMSQGNPVLFEHLRLAVADAVGRRESLPPEVTAWLVRYLRNEVTRPPKQPGEDRKRGLRYLIWTAINHIVATGLCRTPMRNHKAEEISACDAVELAIKDLRKDRNGPLWKHLSTSPQTYSSIKKIWMEINRESPVEQLKASIAEKLHER